MGVLRRALLIIRSIAGYLAGSSLRIRGKFTASLKGVGEGLQWLLD